MHQQDTYSYNRMMHDLIAKDEHTLMYSCRMDTASLIVAVVVLVDADVLDMMVAHMMIVQLDPLKQVADDLMARMMVARQLLLVELS